MRLQACLWLHSKDEYHNHTMPKQFKKKKKKLVARMGAKSAYLGSDAKHRAPHRKVTLLFDADITSESDRDNLLQRIAPSLILVQPLLHESPSLVQPRDRKHECAECNHSAKDHACPFADPSASQHIRRSQPAAGGRIVAQLAPGVRTVARPPLAAAVGPAIGVAAGGSASAVAPGSDAMCRSWRRTKECPRLAGGRPCDFAHPATHDPAVKHCFTFMNSGSCPFGADCRFPHMNKNGTIVPGQQQGAPAAALVLPGSAGAAAASAQPASATTQPRPAAAARARKEADQGDVEEKTAVPSQQALAAGPPAAAAAVQPAAQPTRSSSQPAGTQPSSLTAVNPYAVLGGAGSWSEQTDNASEDEHAAMQALAQRNGRPRATASQLVRAASSAPPPSSLAALASPSKPARDSSQSPASRAARVPSQAAAPASARKGKRALDLALSSATTAAMTDGMDIDTSQPEAQSSSRKEKERRRSRNGKAAATATATSSPPPVSSAASSSSALTGQ